MHFPAFPLLLFASTICASPVHIDSRDISESAREIIKALAIDPTRQFKGLRNKFRSEKAKQIVEWSDPGEQVVRFEQRARDGIKDSIIKKVDLSTVVPVHGSDTEKQHSPQLLQVFLEIKNLERASMLWHYCVNVEEGKLYVYIEMIYPGNPASQTTLTVEQRKESRNLAVKQFKAAFGVGLDSKHNQDKYFGFSDETSAAPFMLRYAHYDPSYITGTPAQK